MITVVTGAAGHIGGNLVRALLENGRRVRAVIFRDTRALDGLEIETVRADLTDEAAVRQAVAGAEIVHHLGARISLEGDPDGDVRRVNVEGTRNVARACLAARVRRLVHFSSVHALEQRPHDGSLDESRPLALGPGEIAYDRSKAEAERVVLDAVREGLDAVIVNPTGVVGPYDFKPSRMGRLLLDLRDRRMPGLVAGGYTWVDVRDVAAGAMAAEDRGRRGERYLLAGEYRSILHVARLVERCTGARPPRIVSPMWLARLSVPLVRAWSLLSRRPAPFTREALHVVREGHPRVSAEKAGRELGFAARPLGETVRDSIAWFGRD